MADLVPLDLKTPIWDRFHLVAPLVLVGTREPDGAWDLAPKHLAMPLGWEEHFGFVCAPSHRTWQNAVREGVWTVSYPRPDQVVLAALAASPRCEDDRKHDLAALPLVPARAVEGVLLRDAALHLECRLERVIEGFGRAGLVVGRVVAAAVAPERLRGPDRDEAEQLLKNPLLAYLPPSRFASIGSTQAFPFPIGWRR